MNEGWTRLGLIAGGGALPRLVAEACAADGRLGCVIALQGFANPADYIDPVVRTIGQFGHVVKDLRAFGCDAVCFAGIVTRPDFRSFVPDMEGAKLLPKLLGAAVRGDDALLRVVVKAFEDQGLKVVGADELSSSLLAPEGLIGGEVDLDAHRGDIAKA
ncbi:MAG TPA: DUF1009 domain-containing protein, partial [Oceanicaulis sp.]|nr:DUF1009 domain-containing protein [Oceanicaulis sp.]